MPVEWYYAKGDKNFGPVEPAELKRLAASGGLLPEDLVWKEGQSQRVRASNVKGLFAATAKPAGVAPRPAPTAAKASAAISATPQGLVPALKTAPTTATFLQWYKLKLGKRSVIVQAVLWIVYGFIWIPVWWLLTRGKLAPTELNALAQPTAAEEAKRQQELEKLERLQGNGTPFIEGEIVRISGISGLAKGMCGLHFESERLVLALPSGKRMPIPYGDVRNLQIAGKGQIVESVDNAFIGGGFGLGGALQGAAQAMLLNAAVSALTRKERFECELAMTWNGGEVVIMNREYLPEVVGHVLHPFIEKLSS